MLLLFIGLYIIIIYLIYFIEWELLNIYRNCIVLTILFDWMSLIFMGFVVFISSQIQIQNQTIFFFCNNNWNYNIQRRKVNWIGHILRRNCLRHDAVDGQMTELKRVGRRRTQLLNYLRNRRRYSELKEEAEDWKRWRRQFINRTKYLP